MRDRAIRDTFAELNAMTPEQLKAAIKKHENGEVAQLLLKAWYPDKE